VSLPQATERDIVTLLYTAAHLDVNPDPEYWRDAAACVGLDPEWWTLGRPENAQAHLICARCPVRELCLADARREPTIGVIRGGHDFSEFEPVVLTCAAPDCKTVFSRPKHQRRKYCSRECRVRTVAADSFQHRRDKLSVPDTAPCEGCGQLFDPLPPTAQRVRRWCSRRCYNESRRPKKANLTE